MKLFEYINTAKTTLKSVLLNAGFINGDELGQSEKLPRKTYFFEYYNEKPKFQNDTYICWQLLDNENNRHADNSKIAGEQFFGVIIVSPQKLTSKEVKNIADKIESEFLKDDRWNLIELTEFREESINRNYWNFTISRVFTK